jgi:phage antirepressor YoqD-like protein
MMRQAMSSREIAELLSSRHDDVKRSILRLAERGVIQLPPLADVRNHLGQTVAEYQICKRDTYIIVAQISPEFTAALVDRWQDLEAQQGMSLPDFSNPAAAARAWAEQFEISQAAAKALEAAAPKIEFVDRYVDSTGLKGFRQTAKLLGANESRFRDWLIAEKIMYRLGGELQARQPHIDAGRFSVKAGMSDSGHNFNQNKFTPKGVSWIAGLWAQHNLQGGEE